MISIEDQDQIGKKLKRMILILRKDQDKKEKKEDKTKTENRVLKNKNLHQILKENSIKEETKAEGQRKMIKKKDQTEKKGKMVIKQTKKGLKEGNKNRDLKESDLITQKNPTLI